MPDGSATEPVSGYGRRRLLDAARVLFDEQGVHGVSARSVAQAAGHRNVGAVSYHFGDLRGLLLAVVEEHAASVDAARTARLDALEAAGPLTPRQGVEAVVAPLADLLDDPDGRRYLRLLNQLANHPEHHGEVSVAFAPSLVRAAAHALPLLEGVEEEVRPHRVQHAIGLLFYALARQARLHDEAEPPAPPLSPARATEELVDAIEAVLRA